MDPVSTQSICEFAPHLAAKPAQPRLPRPVNPRDLEIYQLHTGEKKTIRELSERFELSEIRVWGICTSVRKLAQVGSKQDCHLQMFIPFVLLAA